MSVLLLAVVILGGLVTSTVLNLFIVPSLYLRFGKKIPLSTANSPDEATAVNGPL
jgi:Cu/Ag efflux pump CusA